MADIVIHDSTGSRFVLMRGDEELGFAEYETRDDGGIVFTHTEIRPEIHERGLGSILVEGALEQLRTSTDVRIGATCPFVRKYLSEHPEFDDLTSRGRS